MRQPMMLYGEQRGQLECVRCMGLRVAAGSGARGIPS